MKTDLFKTTKNSKFIPKLLRENATPDIAVRTFDMNFELLFCTLVSYTNLHINMYKTKNNLEKYLACYILILTCFINESIFFINKT